MKIYKSVEVIDIGHKGHALGRTPDGEIVLIEDALPGAEISGSSRRKKKGLPLLRVEEVIRESPFRVTPRCVHFDVCGGCKWQHLAMEQQLHFKEQQVHNAIRRIAGVTDYEALPIVASPEWYGYRNKMEFSFSSKRWLTTTEVKTADDSIDRDALGLHPPGRFDRVVDIDTCLLMKHEVNSIRHFIKEGAKSLGLTFYDASAHSGIMRSLIVRSNRSDHYMLVFVVAMKDPRVYQLMQMVADRFLQVRSIYCVVNAKANDSIHDLRADHFYGDYKLLEKIDDYEFEIGPKSFFQTNILQTEQLYRRVRELAQIQATDVVYDLYTGLGSIAIYLSGDSDKIYGVEEVPAAIEDARVNAQRNQCSTAFAVGRVEDLIDGGQLADWPRPDIVIVDPPRAGLHRDVVHYILALAPRRIVYVSCDPATQARDIAMMKDRYQIISVEPYDMFPHTSHVESVALLQKR